MATPRGGLRDSRRLGLHRPRPLRCEANPPPGVSPQSPPPGEPAATPDRTSAETVNCALLPGLAVGEQVTVTLNLDTPEPRCALVRLDQRLVVVNPQDTAAILTLGQAHWTVPRHSHGSVAISQAVTGPGGYLMHVAGKDRQGGDSVGVVVHHPRTSERRAGPRQA